MELARELEEFGLKCLVPKGEDKSGSEAESDGISSEVRIINMHPAIQACTKETWRLNKLQNIIIFFDNHIFCHYNICFLIPLNYSSRKLHICTVCTQ